MSTEDREAAVYDVLIDDESDGADFVDLAAACVRVVDNPTASQLAGISRWIDTSAGYRGLDAEAHNWRRIQKIAQETGEVFEAYCGSLGENPRKGHTHTDEDVTRELLDVALAALGAVEHRTGNAGRSLEMLFEHVDRVYERAGLLAGS